MDNKDQSTTLTTTEIPTNNTIYINNINEKIKLEGKYNAIITINFKI